MKKLILISSLALVTTFFSCGPAAEDRQKMHDRAKVFQDSIATFIRQSMAEAEAPAPEGAVMVPQPSPAVQPTPAPPQK